MVFMDLVPAVLGFFVPRSYFKVVTGDIDPKLLAQLPDLAFSFFYICSCARRRSYAWAFILYIAIPKK